MKRRISPIGVFVLSMVVVTIGAFLIGYFFRPTLHATTMQQLTVSPPETLPVPPPETLPIPRTTPTTLAKTPTPIGLPETPTPITTSVPGLPNCEAAKLLFASALGQARWDIHNRPTLNAILTAQRLVESGQLVLDGCR